MAVRILIDWCYLWLILIITMMESIGINGIMLTENIRWILAHTGEAFTRQDIHIPSCVTGCKFWYHKKVWLNISSGNGFVPSGNKPLLSQFWPRSMSPYGVTRPQWVKEPILFILLPVDHSLWLQNTHGMLISCYTLLWTQTVYPKIIIAIMSATWLNIGLCSSIKNLIKQLLHNCRLCPS